MQKHALSQVQQIRARKNSQISQGFANNVLQKFTYFRETNTVSQGLEIQVSQGFASAKSWSFAGFTIGTLLMRTSTTIYLIWINNKQHCTLTHQRRYKYFAQKKNCVNLSAPCQLSYGAILATLSAAAQSFTVPQGNTPVHTCCLAQRQPVELQGAKNFGVDFAMLEARRHPFSSLPLFHLQHVEHTSLIH